MAKKTAKKAATKRARKKTTTKKKARGAGADDVKGMLFRRR